MSKPLGRLFCAEYLAAIAGFIFSAQNAIASPVLDQQSTDGSTSFGISCCRLAQTFTAGVTGTLNSIEIQIQATTPLRIDIVSVVGGAPGHDILGSVIPSASIVAAGLDSHWDFSASNISMIAGDQYAIVVSNTYAISLSVINWTGGFGYSGGQALSQFVDSQPWVPPSTYAAGLLEDFQFKTFVDPQPTPEPSTALLVAFPMAAFAVLRRVFFKVPKRQKTIL